MEAELPVVEIADMRQPGRFFGFGKPKVILPRPMSGSELYALRSAPGGHELRIVASGVRMIGSLENNAQYVRVRTSVRLLDTVFPALIEDGNLNKWDLRLKGSWSVSDCRMFLQAFGLEAAMPTSELSVEMVESWIANSLGSHVRDAIGGHSVNDLCDKDSLPARWWEAQMPNWLADCGVSVKVKEVKWQSADAANLQAEQARLKGLARIEEERNRQRQAELREEEANARYDKEKARIEADLALSAKEREHQLQVLELHHRRDIIQAEKEIEDAKRAAEMAAAHHVVAIGQLRHDAETVKTAKAREEEAQHRHKEVVDRLAGVEGVLEKLAALPENLLARLADRDASKANAAAERLVSPEFGISASALAVLGFRVERQSLVDGLRQRSVADGNKIAIRKTELVTRDIGTVKVKGLPVNTSLQFEFSTERTGYVTMLNVGTSGAVYVHVPNAYTAVEHAKVDGGRSYQIPGDELMPWERLGKLGLDYVEIGPPGWEHIAVIVSDEPMIGHHTLAKATSESPFVRLATEDISEFCEALNSAPSESWSADVLSFLVG